MLIFPMSLICFSRYHRKAIDFVDGSNNYFIADENLANDQSKMRFHIHHFRWKRRVLESNLVSVDFLANNYLRAGNHIKFFDKKILLWDKDFKKPTNLAALQLDYIIVSEKANINLMAEGKDKESILSSIDELTKMLPRASHDDDVRRYGWKSVERNA